MNEALRPLSGIIEIIAYSVIAVGIIRSNVKQSFAAFFLWGLLDLIATVTAVIENGNYWLALSNAVGASSIAIILVVKKQVSWSWVETLTAVLVVICLIIWGVAGEIPGLIASSIAVVIAAVPQMVDTYKKPRETPTIAYVIFLTANIMSVFAGTAWSIEERFYGCCGVFLTTVILAFSFRKE